MTENPKHWAVVRAVQHGDLNRRQRFQLAELMRAIGLYADGKDSTVEADAVLWAVVRAQYQMFEKTLET